MRNKEAEGSGDTCSDVSKVVANIFISFIGGGILGLPYAFKRAGIMEGVIIMVLVAAFSVYAMLLLIECKDKAAPILCANPHAMRVNKGRDYTPVNVSDEGSDTDDNGKSSKGSSRR